MKNSIKLSTLTVALLTAFTIGAKAQTSTATTSSTSKSGIILSVGADGGIPIGDMHDRYDWSAGGSVQADFPILKDQLYATLNGGFNNFHVRNNAVANYSNLQMIPVKAGLKFFPVSNFYIQGEAGAAFLLNKASTGYDKSTAFVYAPQAGYQFKVGSSNYLDAGVRFEGNTKFNTGGTSNNFIGLRLAYGFGL